MTQTTSTNDTTTTTGVRRLDKEHRRELVEGSGLTDATIAAAGIYSEFNKSDLAALLNRKGADRSWLPAMVFPYYDASGTVVLQRIKPANPSKDARSGKPKKYLQPSGGAVRAYIPPQVHAQLADAACKDVVITEGEKKTLAVVQAGYACIGLSGVDCWHTKRTVSLIPDLVRIDWKGRQVFIAFDSDAATNDNVTRNERELAAALGRHGAVVKIVRIPPAENGDKQGADDFLVALGAQAFTKLLTRATAPEKPRQSVEKQSAKESDPGVDAFLVFEGLKKRGEPGLRFWRGDWWRWGGGCYWQVPDDEFRATVIKKLDEWLSDIRTNFVASVLDHLRGLAHLDGRKEPPAWISYDNNSVIRWDPADCLVTKSRIVHVPSLIEGKDVFDYPATPAFFATTAADFNLDRDAPEPVAWLRFLNELWGDDPQSIKALQEWFGLLLMSDTSFQKLLLLVGPPRSGKGTIGRILTALVGKGNVAAPTMNSLTTNFGLSPLVGKSVAIISDARLSGRTDQAIVVERILSITGEDMQTIDRKYRSPITCKLPTRFVVLTNELPRLNDASGAIVSRMILLQTRQSWLGKEDRKLESKLVAELPGIMLWAVAGWQRLRQQERLTQPDDGYESLAELKDLASPVAAFLRDCCDVGPGLTTEKASLFTAWKHWCERNGREKIVSSAASFARDLLAANSSIRSRRVGPRGERTHVYEGVAVRPEFAR